MPAHWRRQICLECCKRSGISLNGISAAEESHDLAAICPLVCLKVENDTPNSCMKHFRWRAFSSVKHTEVQQYTIEEMLQLLLLHHQLVFLGQNLVVWKFVGYKAVLDQHSVMSQKNAFINMFYIFFLYSLKKSCSNKGFGHINTIQRSQFRDITPTSYHFCVMFKAISQFLCLISAILWGILTGFLYDWNTW